MLCGAVSDVWDVSQYDFCNYFLLVLSLIFSGCENRLCSCKFQEVKYVSGVLLCCEVAIGLVTKLPNNVLYGIELSGDDLVTTSLKNRFVW